MMHYVHCVITVLLTCYYCVVIVLLSISRYCPLHFILLKILQSQ